MKALALDISSKTGWASSEGRSGVLDLSGHLDDFGKLGFNFRMDLVDLFRDTTPDVVVIERPFAAGKSDLARLPAHLVFVAHETAFGWRIARAEVTPGQWRKAILGNGGMKRTEAKKAALAWCRSRGLSPRDDNEADALAILAWWERFGCGPITGPRRAERDALDTGTAARRGVDLGAA
ncbi:MAG: hypothetical protein IH626_17590 [Rhodospirillales bacterium]|nr:hypothetical protein [Rhodospirillales bacterium]